MERAGGQLESSSNNNNNNYSPFSIRGFYSKCRLLYLLVYGICPSSTLVDYSTQCNYWPIYSICEPSCPQCCPSFWSICLFSYHICLAAPLWTLYMTSLSISLRLPSFMVNSSTINEGHCAIIFCRQGNRSTDRKQVPNDGRMNKIQWQFLSHIFCSHVLIILEKLNCIKYLLTWWYL